MGKGTITVVNRKLMPERGPNTLRIAIDRPHPLQNQFVIGIHGTRSECIEKYRLWLPEEFCKDIDSLHLTPVEIDILRIHKAWCDGKDVELVCNCKPKPCHGDVIKEFVENL
jgi:hypothetical protein